MAAIGIIGSVLSFVGTIAAANAAKQQAEAENQAARHKALMEEQRAMAERATAQRQSLRTRREEDLAQSKLQARAAASGGGAGAADPSVITLGTELAEEGEYQALGQMWEGEMRGRQREDQAALDRYMGEQRLKAAKSRANASILGGIGGLVGGLGKGFG